MAIDAQRRIAIRPMTAADIRAVQRVERAAYGPNVPRTPFEREITNGLAQYFVAVERGGEPEPPHGFDALRRLFHLGGDPDERVVGFLGLWYTVDQLHIVTIAVDPSAQTGGIGQRLLLEAFHVAAESELRTIALEVRPSNAPALHVYEKFGFAHVGRLRAYYSDNGEDALVMLTPELASAEHVALISSLREQHLARFGDAFEARDPEAETAEGS